MYTKLGMIKLTARLNTRLDLKGKTSRIEREETGSSVMEAQKEKHKGTRKQGVASTKSRSTSKSESEQVL